jgi:two-component system secretion system response regulator SalR
MNKLTRREREVAEQLATGSRQCRIADDLVISRRTVYNHIRSIRNKIGANSAFEAAVILAMERQSLVTIEK